MALTTAGTSTPARAGDALAAALLVEAAPPALLVRPDGRLLQANPAARRLLGDAAPDGSVLERLAGVRGLAEMAAVVAQVGRRGGHRTHCTAVDQGGRTQALAWAVSGAPDGAVLLVGVDISTTRQEIDALQSRACTDELTGLANRAGLLRGLEERAGTGADLLFCDLNGFKAVNDTHGHGAGDQVLIEVARRFRRAVRGEDLVARLGGDEFVVLAAPSPTADAAGLRRRIVGAVQQPMVLPGGLVVLVGVAVGVAELARGTDPLVALQEADAAMYEAKPTRRSVAAVVHAAR